MEKLATTKNDKYGGRYKKTASAKDDSLGAKRCPVVPTSHIGHTERQYGNGDG